jgi:electron transport complex protein RnfD
MRFGISPAPHVKPATSVSKVMLQVLLALVPATLAYIWYFGWGIIIQMAIGIIFALAAEALMLLWRDRPLKPFLSDYSAVITAVLLAFAVPPTAPWWLIAIGVTFAIVFAKHLYGGLGYNPFNPAMAGYVVLLVSFPQEITTWLAPEQLVHENDQLSFLQTVITILGGSFPAAVNVDAVTAATPLDAMRTELGNNRTIQEIRQSPLFGDMGGVGWEWIGNYIAIGGLWLMYRRVIRWQIPFAVIMGVGIPAFLFYVLDPGSHASAPFHVFSGATLLCAFFIATDPVTAASSEKGRLVYGFGIGVLIYIIRTWGGYPDAVAFAVLLMNMAVPLIDHYTKPRTYGHGR